MVVVAWSVLVLAGFFGMAAYSYSAGADRPTMSQMNPLSTRQKWTLIVGIHPQCPCTRATAHELEQLMQKLHGRLACRAFVYYPDGLKNEWMASPLVEQLRRTTGIEVRSDHSFSNESNHRMPRV